MGNQYNKVITDDTPTPEPRQRDYVFNNFSVFDKDEEYKYKPRRRPRRLNRKERLIREQKEQKILEMELFRLSRTKTIVNGYTKKVLPKLSCEEIPLDILNLICEGVGDMFTAEQSCREIIQLVGHVRDPMVDWVNPYGRDQTRAS